MMQIYKSLLDKCHIIMQTYFKSQLVKCLNVMKIYIFLKDFFWLSAILLQFRYIQCVFGKMP